MATPLFAAGAALALLARFCRRPPAAGRCAPPRAAERRGRARPRLKRRSRVARPSASPGRRRPDRRRRSFSPGGSSAARPTRPWRSRWSPPPRFWIAPMDPNGLAASLEGSRRRRAIRFAAAANAAAAVFSAFPGRPNGRSREPALWVLSTSCSPIRLRWPRPVPL